MFSGKKVCRDFAAERVWSSPGYKPVPVRAWPKPDPGQPFLSARHYWRALATYPGVVAARAAPSSPIWSCSTWGFPCRHTLPRPRCALTAPFHPYPAGLRQRGGTFSVALSV